MGGNEDGNDSLTYAYAWLHCGYGLLWVDSLVRILVVLVGFKRAKYIVRN